MILTAVAVIAISQFAIETIGGYFSEKGLDKIFSDEKSLKEHLERVIQETVLEYQDQYPQNSGRLLPFYHSKEIVAELLKYRLMHSGDYDFNALKSVIEADTQVSTPSEENLRKFFSLFSAKVNADQELKTLEISQTFEEEIFQVSSAIKNLSSSIDYMTATYSGDLEQQWNNRLETYITALKQFRPKTALALILSLETSIQTATKRPSTGFMALLEYQKGQCFGFLQNKTEANRSLIKAYLLDKTNINFAQAAANAYLRIGETDECLAVCKEILETDPFDGMAHAFKLICSSIEQFDEAIAKVPFIVRNDTVFKRTLYNAGLAATAEEFHEKLKEYGLIPSFVESPGLSLNIDTFNQYIYWINITFSALFEGLRYDHSEFKVRKKLEAKALILLLEPFIKMLDQSEIVEQYSHIKFMYWYCRFSLDGSIEHAREMEKSFADIVAPQLNQLLMLANCLELAGEIGLAIQVMKQYVYDSTDYYSMMILLSIKNGDDVGYIDNAKRYINAISEFLPEHLFTVANILIEFATDKNLIQIPISDVTEKTFKEMSDRDFILQLATLLYYPEKHDAAESLIELSVSIKDEQLLSVIAHALFVCGHFEKSVAVFRMFIDTVQDNKSHFFYIRALSGTKTDHQELLNRLQYWRCNRNYMSELLRLEAQLRADLVDWLTVEEICRYYFSDDRQDESMFTMWLVALNKLDSAEANEQIRFLADAPQLLQVQEAHNVKVTSHILIKHGCYNQAYDLLYPFAADPKNKELRLTYFIETTKLPAGDDEQNVMRAYDLVEKGHYVKYERDRTIGFIHLDDKALQEETWARFLGKTVNEVVLAKQPITGAEFQFKILRIMNKFLCLHDEIMEQVKDPFSGLGMVAIDYDPAEPGSILNQLQKMFGELGSILEHRSAEQFEKYYQGEISLSEISMAVFQGQIFEAYYHLARFKKGIQTVPLIYYRHQHLENATVVLDYSSLIFVYQCYSLHQTDFSRKFVISGYIVEQIKAELKSIKVPTQPELSVSVTTDRIEPMLRPEIYFQNRQEHLNGLLLWIANNCDVKVSARTIDFIREKAIKIGESPLLDAALSTALLIEEHPGSILATDDMIYLKFNLVNIYLTCSSEVLAKSHIKSDDPAMGEFLENHFIRYSPTIEQLNAEYQNHLAGRPSHYSQCLDNLSLLHTSDNLFNALRHLKEISLSSFISHEKMQADLTAVMVGLLRGVGLDVRSVVREKIWQEFSLLGTLQDKLIRSFYDACEILDASY